MSDAFKKKLFNNAVENISNSPVIWNAPKVEDDETIGPDLRKMPVVGSAMEQMTGGLSGLIGSALTGLGAQAKGYENPYHPGEYVEGTNAIGDQLIQWGNYWNKEAQKRNAKYGPSQKWVEKDLMDKLTDTDYLLDPRGLRASMFQGLGTSLPFMALGGAVGVGSKIAPAVLGPASNVARGLGMSRVADLIGGKAIEQLVGEGINYGMSAGPLDAFINASEMYEDLKKQGKSNAEIAQTIRDATVEELPYDILQNALFGSVVEGKLGNLLAGEGAGLARRTAAGVTGMGVDALGEKLQEANQTRITNKYSGKPYSETLLDMIMNPTKEEKEAGNEGFVGSLLPGGFGAMHTILHGNVDNTIENNAGNYTVDGGAGQQAITPVNMPTQGEDIDAQVEALNPELKQALPTIGGILHNLGIDGAEISSAARTPEHNAEVGGAPNSYHTHADAVDIVLPEGTTAEKAEEVKKYFEDSGAFEEVLFHDAGSGYHLHLGGYNGNLGNTTNTQNTAPSAPISDYSSEANEDMYADFAENLLNTTNDADTVNEVSSMFDDKDNFINTPENRKTLWEKHGEEMQQYYNDRMESGKKQTAEIAENAMQEEAPAPAELKTPTAPKGSANLNAPISFTNAPTGTISRVEGLSDKGGNVNTTRPRSMPIELNVPTQEAQEPQRTYQYNPQRGMELIKQAQEQNVNLSRRLQAGLEKGYPKAIETAEAGIKSHIENSVIPEQETQEAPAPEAPKAEYPNRRIAPEYYHEVGRDVYGITNALNAGAYDSATATSLMNNILNKIGSWESTNEISAKDAKQLRANVQKEIDKLSPATIENNSKVEETPKKTAKERADEIKNKIDGVEKGLKNGTIDYAMASELIGDIKKEIADAKAKDEITAAMAEKLSSRADKVLAKAKPMEETAKQEKPSEGNESGTLYFKNDNDDYVYAEYGPNTNRTKDYVLNFAKEKGFTQQVSKEEFEKHGNDKLKKQAEERMKKLFEAEDIEGIIDMLKSNDNVWSRDAFSELSGVKLSPKQGERLKQVKDYYGDKYTKWQEEKAKADKEKEQQEIKKQEQKKKEETEAAEKDWNDGKYITGDEFLLLCDKYEVNVPISTKGTLKNKIQGIRNDGRINTATKKYPQGVSNVYHQLKEQMVQGEQQKAEDMKSGKAWENVINKDRVDTLTDEEMKVVDAIFSGKGPQIVSTNGQEKAEEAPKAEEPKKETPKAETEKTGFEGGFAGAGKYLRKKNKAQKDEIKLVNVFNEDELDDEIAKLADELNNLSANPVFNPNIYKSLLKIGGIYVQKGINKFAQWADKMVDAFTAKGVDESKIRPWLTSVWEGLSSYPSNFRFDDEMMSAFVQAIGELHNEGVTEYKDVLKRFNEEYEAEDVKQLEPVIKAAYNGIEKFFTDMKEVQGNEQREQSKGTDGRHEGIQSERSRGNERESTGEISERGGRKGEELSGSTRGENTERPATSGIREGTELEASAGNGDNQRGNTGEVSLTPAQANPSPTETPGHDYEIKKSAEGKKSASVRFKQNIEAIKLLKQLETDNRMPTPKEQEILAAYNGWGSLTNAFMDGTKENKELKELLTSEEYEAALSSSRDAFYTPPAIVRAIWEGVSRLGFNGGRILDPSMGVGNFFGTMPRDMMKNSTMTGVELDNLSSRFAKMLYPSAYVENTGFQKASAANNFFDLVISNIPFGQKKIQGYQVHNYFFANGIDKVRPGGLMVYITSQGSLASGKDAERMRTYLAQKADLIAAYKLPSGTFEDAGTGVTTDIVIFQKRGVDGVQSPHAQNFLTVNRKGSYYDGYNVNEYFDSHEENIIGETSVGRDQFGNKALQVKPSEGMNIAKELSKAMKKLPTVYEQVDRSNQPQFNPVDADKKARADEKTRDLEYYVKDGKVVQNQNGEAVAVTGKTAATIKDYIKIKDALNSLFIAQRDPQATDSQLKTLRDNLNKAYDSFVKKYGYLNGAVSRVFKQDPSAGMVMALEKTTFEGKKLVGVEKSDIFTTRTMSAVQEVTSAKTPDDAFLASLANRGRVDVDYMAKLLGSTPDKVVSALRGKIFKNPATEAYESRDEYLSGNVREKLAQAETAAKQDKSYQGNVDELKKVIPEDFVSDEIIVNMGAPWIPESDVQDFVNYLVGSDDSMKVKFLQGAAKWVVAGYGRNARFNADGIKLDEMLECILNNKPIRIYEGRGDDRRYDEKKSDAAEMVANDLRSEFTRWLWGDKDREKRLVRYYNDNYNNMVPRTYDGSHLDPHVYGMNSKIKLKPHQKDVVWRIIQSGNTLIAHCVGAGKTFEMQTAGMEMRRLGLANKPMYCLPNNVVEQFAREFRTLYPAAKLLVLQSSDVPAVPKAQYKVIKHEDGRKEVVKASLKDLSKADRQKIIDTRAARNRILSRIQTEDWDGIIVSHNMFQRFPLTPETTASFIQEQIDVLERTIIEAKGANMNKRDIKTLEDKKDKLKEKYDSVLSSDLDDIGIPFEQLGIDQLFVDEADMFKNLYFPTTLGDIHGISNTDAARSNDMFAKTQWLSRTLNGRGVVFATGTPISNTISEEFTMLRYLDMRGLKEKALDLFDNWIRTFGDIGQDLERKPDGSGFRFVTKVKSFVNMADLTKMFTKVADIKRQEDLNLDIPKLKNDKATVVKLEPDPVVVDYIKHVVPKRIEAMKGSWRKKKGADNMLSLTNDLRKLSMTDGKINACADQIAKKFEETADIKGAQLVFCDIGIPKTDKATESETDTVDNESEKENSTTYEKLIKALQERGIPKEQIAFVQSAKNKAQMDALFQKVDKGEVRILIGSTQKMGAGTNCQHHLVALHDLDAPWRPRDLEQRHGRILRQGNPNKTVEIFNYVVQDSFDAIMWEKLKNKAAIIAQAMNPNTTLRVVEDADLVTLSYAEVEEAATGNPLIKEQLNLQQEVTKLRHAQTEYKRKIRDAETDMEQYPVKIEAVSNAIGKVEKDIANRTETKGDAFTMKLGSQTFNKRKDAEEALKTILGKFSKNVSTEIGEIGGMKVKAMKVASYDVGEETESRIVIQLVGNQAYQVKTNSVVGIENTLQNEPEKVLEDLKQQKARAERNLKDAKEIADQPNPYAERLTDAEKRLNDVMYRIKHEMVGDNSQGETETANNKESATEKTEKSNTWFSREDGKSKNGEKSYYANMSDYSNRDIVYKVMPDFVEAARPYNGYYTPMNGGRFVFKTDEDRSAFIRDMSQKMDMELNKGAAEKTADTLTETPNETAPSTPATEESTKDRLDRYKCFRYDGGYVVEETDTYRDVFSGKADAKVRDYAKEYGGKWEPGVSGTHGRFVFETKTNARNFLRDFVLHGADEILDGTEETPAETAAKDLANDERIKDNPNVIVGAVTSDGIKEVKAETPASDNFTAGEFKHTKTGEMIPQAKPEKQVDRDTYKQVAECAKRNGGYWSRYSKSFLFKDASGRDAFIKEADGIMNGEKKYSVDAGAKRVRRNAAEIKEEILDAFPGVSHVEVDSNTMKFEMPNGAEVTVRIVDTINNADDAEARRAHGIEDNIEITVNGYTITTNSRALITLARDGRENSVYHELFHVVFDMALTNREKNALIRAYTEEARRTGKDVEEVIADKYRDWIEARKRHGYTSYSKLFQRIQDVTYGIENVIKKVRELITGQNADVDKVFSRIESGEIWERPLDNETREHDNIIKDELVHRIETIRDNIKDGFDYVDVRERILSKENREVQRLLETYNDMPEGSAERETIKDILKEAVHDADRKRIILNRKETVRDVQEALQGGNAGGSRSNLQRDISRIVGKGYQELDGSLSQIPGEYRRVWQSPLVQQIIEENRIEPQQGRAENNQDGLRNARIHYSSKQGNISRAMDRAYMNAVSKYQNAKSDAEKTAALETLQKMVNEAAKEAGFENAIPEQTRAYTVRTTAAPKKTQKAYKLFTVDEHGRPSALFVSSADTLPQNVWLDANDTFNFTDQSNGRKYIPSTKNPNSKGGATGKSIKLSDVSEADKAELERLGYIKKNKNGEYPKTITALAYRPGWHAGDLPFFPQGGKQGDGTTNYKNIHRYNQVVFECEMAADVDYTTTSTNSKGQVVFHDMQEMPTDGGYKFATNPMAKAQDIGSWYISGSLKIGRALTEAECNKILAKNGFKPQEWQAYGVGNDFVIGKLDLAKLGYTGEQFDAARKTLAPITYDDDGNVIPLSERFDADKDDIRYSISVEDEETAPSKAEEVTSSWFDKLTNKFAKKMSLNADKIKTAARKEEPSIGLYDSIFGSPGRIAKRVAAFKPFFQMADKAMHKLTKLRSDYLKDLGKAMDIVKTDAERQDLTSILWMGDAEGKEYTDDELHANGASDNVIKAYRRVRSLIRRVGDALDDAKRRPQWKTENNVSDAHIEELRKDKFVDPKSIKVSTNADGKKVVSYKEYANHERTYEGITEEALAQMYADDAIEVLSATKRADGLYDVDVREGFGGLNRLGGYIPHFFHEYMIRLQTSDGKRTVIGSGRTEAEAVKIAEEWLKNNTIPDDAEIFIAPKSANFETLGMKEDAYAPIMGDKDFWKMQKLLAKNNDLTLKEAKEIVNGSIKQKNRHRFYGNFMHRTGAEGFEDNMQWVLRHYVNSAARYIAMETEFKPKAMSLFERLFGAYDKDYSGKDIQQYVKEYINDINGNPSTLETRINKFLNNMNLPFFGKAWQKYVVPKFGDRAALTLASNLTGRVSYLTLGMLNASSALINLTQLMNAAAYTGDVPHLMKRFAQASHGKLGFNDMKVLVQSGVLHDIGIDTGSGYDQNRGYTASGLGKLSKALKLVDTVGKNSMYLFKKVDMLCRVSTVLAAYDKAIAEGKTKQEALEYAKEIDRKSNFEYGVQDAPNVFRRGSILSQLMLQFKKYGFKELEVMGDMLSDKTSSKQKLIFWGLYLLSAGLMGIPAMDWLDDSLEGFGLHFKDTIQKGIMELCGTSEEGKALAKVLMYGGLAAANINVSSRVGLTDVVPTRMSDILGPTVSKLWNFSKDTATGNYAGALRDVSPGLYNIYTAIAGEALGKRGRKNTTYDTMYERLLRAMGFKSVDESLPVDVQRILSNERKERTSERQRMIDDFISEPTGEKARKLKEAGITPKQVQAERDKKKQDRAGRLEGGLQKREKGSYLTEYLK